PLDVGVERSRRVPVHEGGDERGLQHVLTVHEVVEGVVENTRCPPGVAPRVEADLTPQLAQRGVGEDEGGGGDPGVHHRVPENAPHLPPLDLERWCERHRSLPDEDRGDRAPCDGGRQIERPVLELELDGVALQRHVPYGRDRVATGGHAAELVEHGLVAIGSGSGSRRSQLLGARRRHRAAGVQQRGDSETADGGHTGLRGRSEQEMWRWRQPCDRRPHVASSPRAEGALSDQDRLLAGGLTVHEALAGVVPQQDRKSTRLNSSHLGISYAVFCLKKKKKKKKTKQQSILNNKDKCKSKKQE